MPKRALVDPENPYLEAILLEATRLFSRKGYRGTSMRELGDGLGLHAGSLYVHIRSKEDLLFAVIDRICRLGEQQMREIMASAASPIEKFRQVAVKQLELVSENREAATIYFHEWKNLSPSRRARVIKSRDRWETQLRQIISECVGDGSFRPIDIKLAGIALISMLNWTYQWYDPKGPTSGAELANIYADFLIRGLQAT